MTSALPKVFSFFVCFAASWSVHQRCSHRAALPETPFLVTHLVNYNANTKISFKKEKKSVTAVSAYLRVLCYYRRCPWFSPLVNPDMISHSRAHLPWDRSGSLDPKWISLLDPEPMVEHLFSYLQSFMGYWVSSCTFSHWVLNSSCPGLTPIPYLWSWLHYSSRAHFS